MMISNIFYFLLNIGLFSLNFHQGHCQHNDQEPPLTPVENQLLDYAYGKQEPDVITTSWGSPVSDISNSLTAGNQGPVLMQDTTFFDIMQYFNRERIPERVVHAKGAGAFGYFEVTHDVTSITSAQVFSRIGLRTNVSVRFSQVGGEMGSADTTRDVRGFSVKFHTEEGNWDLVGNNLPVFFVRDSFRFIDLIHSQRRNPQTHLHDMNMYWDFASSRPETTHLLMYVHTGLGIPASYRTMNGFGVHAFKLVNDHGDHVYVKFHWISAQGVSNLTNEDAMFLAGSEPDYYISDLFNAISIGQYPRWTLNFQIMTEEEAHSASFNPFDATKEWPVTEFPLFPVGEMVLTTNQENYFVDVEQIGFCPNRLVPGIEPSQDKLLQGRLFAYADTQHYRLGVNNQKLRVNRPYDKIRNYERDGFARPDDNQGNSPNYYPNSFNGPRNSPRGYMSTFPVYGQADRYDSTDEDNFSQPREFWRRLSRSEREFLVSNLATSLRRTYPFIQQRALDNFYQVSEEMAQMLAASLQTTLHS